MKRFSKIMLSVAAVSAVSAAMAVSSMAMTATYESGSVTLSGVPSTGTSQTLLIVGADGTTAAKDVTVTSDNASTVVKQIDQKDDSTTFETSATQLAIPVGELAAGTYQVRIGGTDCPTIQTCEFTVGGGSDTPATKEIYVGDANLSGGIDSLDLGNVLRYINSETTRIGSAGNKYKKANSEDIIIVGDANLSGGIDSLDVGNILRYISSETTRIGAISETPIVVEDKVLE